MQSFKYTDPTSLNSKLSFTGTKRPEREPDHWPPCTIQVKTKWHYTNTPPPHTCALMGSTEIIAFTLCPVCIDTSERIRNTSIKAFIQSANHALHIYVINEFYSASSIRTSEQQWNSFLTTECICEMRRVIEVLRTLVQLCQNSAPLCLTNPPRLQTHF